MTKRFKDELSKVIAVVKEALDREKNLQGECLVSENYLKRELYKVLNNRDLHNDLIAIPYRNKFGIKKIYKWGLYDTRGNWPNEVREVFLSGLDEVKKYFTEEGQWLYDENSVDMKSKLERTLFQARLYESVKKYKENRTELNFIKELIYIEFNLKK